MAHPDTLTAPPVDAVPELQRLQLQNLLLMRQVCEEQLNVLTLRFLQTAEPQALRERVQALTNSVNALTAKVFDDFKLDPEKFQLDINKGTFVKRS